MSTVPDTLVQFRQELESAIAVENARRVRDRRRLTFGSAAVALGAAALVIGLLNVLPGPGLSIVERAGAALDTRGNTILHVKTETRWVAADGSVDVWREEYWQRRLWPYASRFVVRSNVPDDPALTGGQVRQGRRVTHYENGPDSIYDPRTGTIYVNPPRPPTLWSAPRHCAREGVATPEQLHNCAYPFFTPGDRPGSVRVTELTKLNDEPPYRYRIGNRVVSEKEAWRIQRSIESLDPREPLRDLERDRIRLLLERNDVVVDRRVRVDGRDAIRLTWNSGRSVYLVDAQTYAPIELRETKPERTRTLRFLVYESLPVNARTKTLLSIRAQHPNARVIRDRAAYLEASRRLLIRG